MRIAYSYIRMSTDKQLKGDSLRRQLDASETYAKNNDLELVDSIDGISLKDIGVSGFRGKNAQDGTLGIFLDALESGKIKPNSVLLIESLDRLSRDRLTSALTQFMRILELGIEIITLTDNQKYSKAGINQNVGALFVSLGIMFRANEESETKSKRLSAAWSNKRTNIDTKILTKTCPAWIQYSEETKKFEIVEGRDKVVKLIFDMCINTGGLFSIARYLNENKVPVFGKGKLWYISYVKKIIVNRSVIGEFQPHMMIDGKRQKVGEPISDYFPKIIDENTYLLAQVNIARRTLNGKGRKGTNFTNLFAGLSYCGSCGTRMMLRNCGGNHNSSRYLVCNNKMVRGGCQSEEWNLADFEAIIFRHLKEVNFTDLINTNNDDKTMSLEDQKLALNEKLKTKEIEINNAVNMMINPKTSPTLRKRYDSKSIELDAEIINIQHQIDDLTKQIMDKVDNETVFSTMALKEMIEELKTRKDDYEFRSSVNNFLTRVIDKFELIDANESFMPWDLDEDDLVVKSYRHTYPVRLTRTLDEIVSSEDFKQFYRRYNREIRIHYQTGAIRNILYGNNMSFSNAETLKLLAKAKVKPDTSTVVTDAKEPVKTAIDKPIQES